MVSITGLNDIRGWNYIIMASSQTSGTLGAACQEMLHSAGVAMPKGHAALGASDCPNLQEQHVFCKSHGFSDTLCLGPPNYHTNVFGVLCQNDRPPKKIAAWILEIAPLLWAPSTLTTHLDVLCLKLWECGTPRSIVFTPIPPENPWATAQCHATRCHHGTNVAHQHDENKCRWKQIYIYM